MINLSTMMDLYRYMEWADSVVWKCALENAAARGDSKVHDSFYHLHLVQRAFLRIWRGEQLEATFPQFKDLPEMLSWARGYYDELFAFSGTLHEENLSAPMPMPWAERAAKRLGSAPEVTSVGETFLQVILHSQHHRGQICTRLRECGVDPPLVDYIGWVWTARPAPVWELVSRAEKSF